MAIGSATTGIDSATSEGLCMKTCEKGFAWRRVRGAVYEGVVALCVKVYVYMGWLVSREDCAEGFGPGERLSGRARCRWSVAFCWSKLGLDQGN